MLILIIATLWLKFWEGVPFDQILIRSGATTIGVAAALTVVVPKWRRSLWAQPCEWVRSLRIRTLSQLRKLRDEGYDEGYNKRSDEVDVERKSAQIPFWEVRQRDEFFYLYNHGNTVQDVRLTAPADSFVINERSGWWKEHDFPGGGKQFQGHLTNKGRAEGVSFTVRWLDRNGDERFGPALLHQSQIVPFESPEEAYERGAAAGRAEAKGTV